MEKKNLIHEIFIEIVLKFHILGKALSVEYGSTVKPVFRQKVEMENATNYMQFENSDLDIYWRKSVEKRLTSNNAIIWTNPV